MIQSTRRFTGFDFLLWMGGSFIVVLAANLVLVYVALTTFSGEVAHGAPPGGLRMMQVLPKAPAPSDQPAKH